MNWKIILAGIILLGLLLRVLFINTSPPSLYGDELTITLDAYSLLKTGHDQLGNSFPLTFPMGAGRPAGYVYFSIPFVAIFGPTVLGVRSLSILSGLGIIILLYLLCRKLFSEKVGLFAAAVSSVSPWDISLSRGGFEAHFALFLSLLGTYLFFKGKEKSIFYSFSALCFGLALHTYPTYKVILPLFFFLLFWFIGINKIFVGKAKKYIFGGAIILLLLVITSFSQTFIGGSETRFFSINVFSQEKLNSEIEQKINLERNITHLPKSLLKYFHNKPVEYVKVVGENYLQNFSTDFLFIHGDRNPRHNMATIGEFYLVEFVLILIGLVSFWKQKKIILFLIGWILIAPLPTAVMGDPHALRSALMFPPLTILSVLGLFTLFTQRNKIPLVLVTILFIIQFAFFLQKLYFLAPAEYASFWAYPARLSSEEALKNKENYDYIFLSDKIDSVEFGYPVYAKVDPVLVIDQNNKKTMINGYNFKKFDNVYIGFVPEQNTDEFLSNVKGRVLYIGESNLSKYLKNYETINGVDRLNPLVITHHD